MGLEDEGFPPATYPHQLLIRGTQDVEVGGAGVLPTRCGSHPRVGSPSSANGLIWLGVR